MSNDGTPIVYNDMTTHAGPVRDPRIAFLAPAQAFEYEGRLWLRHAYTDVPQRIPATCMTSGRMRWFDRDTRVSVCVVRLHILGANPVTEGDTL